MEDFDYARDKVLMGAKREEVLKQDEKEKTAYHEAGHTLRLVPAGSRNAFTKLRSFRAVEHSVSRRFCRQKIASARVSANSGPIGCPIGWSIG